MVFFPPECYIEYTLQRSGWTYTLFMLKQIIDDTKNLCERCHVKCKSIIARFLMIYYKSVNFAGIRNPGDIWSETS